MASRVNLKPTTQSDGQRDYPTVIFKLMGPLFHHIDVNYNDELFCHAVSLSMNGYEAQSLDQFRQWIPGDYLKAQPRLSGVRSYRYLLRINTVK